MEHCAQTFSVYFSLVRRTHNGDARKMIWCLMHVITRSYNELLLQMLYNCHLLPVYLLLLGLFSHFESSFLDMLL